MTKEEREEWCRQVSLEAEKHADRIYRREILPLMILQWVLGLLAVGAIANLIRVVLS